MTHCGTASIPCLRSHCNGRKRARRRKHPRQVSQSWRASRLTGLGSLGLPQKPSESRSASHDLASDLEMSSRGLLVLPSKFSNASGDLVLDKANETGSGEAQSVGKPFFPLSLKTPSWKWALLSPPFQVQRQWPPLRLRTGLGTALQVVVCQSVVLGHPKPAPEGPECEGFSWRLKRLGSRLRIEGAEVRVGDGEALLRGLRARLAQAPQFLWRAGPPPGGSAPPS